MKNLSPIGLEDLANLPSLSFTLNMRLDKTDQKSILYNLLIPLSLIIESDQFKHWKPGDARHTIFEDTINNGDNLRFVITFKIVYAPYQCDIKEKAIESLSEVLSQIAHWSHKIRDGVNMTIVLYNSAEVVMTRNVSDN